MFLPSVCLPCAVSPANGGWCWWASCCVFCWLTKGRCISSRTPSAACALPHFGKCTHVPHTLRRPIRFRQFACRQRLCYRNILGDALPQTHMGSCPVDTLGPCHLLQPRLSRQTLPRRPYLWCYFRNCYRVDNMVVNQYDRKKDSLLCNKMRKLALYRSCLLISITCDREKKMCYLSVLPFGQDACFIYTA